MNTRLAILGLFAALMVRVSPDGSAQTINATNKAKPFVVRETFRRETLQPEMQGLETRQKGIVGLDLRVQENTHPMVQGVFKGTPAEKSGFQTGDAILAVNGVSTLGKSRSTLDEMISDVPGEVIHFNVLRDKRTVVIALTVISLSDASQSLRARFLEKPLP